MTFRITTLLYLFALLAASLAVFGVWGGAVAAVIGFLTWWQRNRHVARLLGVVMVLYICYLALLVHSAREQARTSTCHGHFHWVAHHLLLYHDIHGRLPSPIAEVPPKNYEHSWRAQLLPVMDSWSRYDFSQPWNGPANSALPPYNSYQCPTHAYGAETNCLAIVGPNTAWGDGVSRKFEDITDGRERTILLLESSHRQIDWKQPRDLTFDEAVELLTAPVDPLTFDGHFQVAGPFRKPMYHRSAAMADGTCRRLRVPLSRELAIALLTANGSEHIDLTELERLGDPEWDFAKIWSFVALASIALLLGAPGASRHLWPRRVSAPKGSLTAAPVSYSPRDV